MNPTIGLLVSRGWMSLCAFGTFVVIGQTLTPTEFGIFALASSISLLPHGLVGSGFYERTMSRTGEPGEFQTSYWCTALMGFIGWAVILMIAAVLWFVFDEDSVAGLLAALSFATLSWGFSAIYEAGLLREGKGGHVAGVLVLAETVGFIAMAIGLEAGFGVISLAVGRCANAVVTLAGYWIVSRTPVGGFNWRQARQMLGYSIDMMLNRMLHWVDGYGGDIVVAAVLHASGLGLYRMGMRLFAAVGAVVLTAPSAAHIATAGTAADTGPARVSAVTSRYIRLHAMFGFPVLAIIAASAGTVVSIFLKPQWAASADVAALLCLLAPSWVVGGATSAVLLARGETRKLLYINIANAVIGVAAVLLGAIGEPEGIAASKAIVAMAFTLSIMLMAQTLDRHHVWRTLHVVGVALIASLLCAAAMTMVMEGLHDTGPALVRIVKLALASAFGLGVYGLTLWALARNNFRLSWCLLERIVRPRRRGSGCMSHAVGSTS